MKKIKGQKNYRLNCLSRPTRPSRPIKLCPPPPQKMNIYTQKKKSHLPALNLKIGFTAVFLFFIKCISRYILYQPRFAWMAASPPTLLASLRSDMYKQIYTLLASLRSVGGFAAVYKQIYTLLASLRSAGGEAAVYKQIYTFYQPRFARTAASPPCTSRYILYQPRFARPAASPPCISRYILYQPRFARPAVSPPFF